MVNAQMGIRHAKHQSVKWIPNVETARKKEMKNVMMVIRMILMDVRTIANSPPVAMG
jgi:hypothetical protein